VNEGDAVRRGDVLFELVSHDADAGVDTPVIAAPAEGALEVAVQSGMQVYKGQVLSRVHDLK
jgi:predicted deacylase